MSARFRTEVLARDGDARRLRVHTPRGSFETPVFMPVGTRGVVVHLDAGDYEALGAEIVLGNTYHLMLRPGAGVVEELGGLHAFTSWPGHLLTDSGGYQVMSLDRRVRIDDDGVTFTSVYDGDTVRLTPERAVAVQEQLGADIQMALDQCPALPAPPADVEAAMRRTHEWVVRAQAAHTRADQALFGIVQGGTDLALRRQSGRFLADLDLPGYGIGGLSVGEERADMLPALAAAVAELPEDRPRYLMGVGDPANVVEAVARGVDMFDCVLPTRLARHGTVLTGDGRINLRNARYANDPEPLDPSVEVSARWSRGCLRHLLKVGEPSAGRILTLHNLAFLFGLIERTRTAIEDGRLAAWRTEVADTWD
jgi:queuine tRNA-ribosyltransferase